MSAARISHDIQDEKFPIFSTYAEQIDGDHGEMEVIVGENTVIVINDKGARLWNMIKNFNSMPNDSDEIRQLSSLMDTFVPTQLLKPENGRILLRTGTAMIIKSFDEYGVAMSTMELTKRQDALIASLTSATDGLRRLQVGYSTLPPDASRMDLEMTVDSRPLGEQNFYSEPDYSSAPDALTVHFIIRNIFSNATIMGMSGFTKHRLNGPIDITVIRDRATGQFSVFSTELAAWRDGNAVIHTRELEGNGMTTRTLLKQISNGPREGDYVDEMTFEEWTTDFFLSHGQTPPENIRDSVDFYQYDLLEDMMNEAGVSMSDLSIPFGTGRSGDRW